MNGEQHKSHIEASDEALALPPRPNPLTGDPTPPPAPGYRGPARKPNDGQASDPSWKPSPPAGLGPVLAFYRENPTANLGYFLVTLACLIPLMSIISLVQGDGFAILGLWQIWCILIVTAYLITDPFTYRTVSAGADWIQWSYNKKFWSIRRRAIVLKTYELTRIHGYTPKWGGPHLELRDSKGHKMDASIKRFQGDRQVWDLLYNGVLHSLANGAEISHDGVNIFRLASHPVCNQARVY